jgi:hypothetical protein
MQREDLPTVLEIFGLARIGTFSLPTDDSAGKSTTSSKIIPLHTPGHNQARAEHRWRSIGARTNMFIRI